MSKQSELLHFRQEQLKRQIGEALDLLQGSLHRNPSQRGYHLTFKVDDLTKTYAMLIDRGAGPTEIDPSVYGGWSAYVKDPDGNWIEIYQQGLPTDSPIPEGY